ncbi:DUF5723 family protein [Pontibacter sp. G13]|uniref:DUF5723 family protein n=1 Tax=Pontibacter sp. G13 TaxID=3074898 RepID=UPI00288A91B4|nr:DUF5723 family protein [Pontibacter sp. G13]WNJ18497.1 DUF5723 family protein [Pontibacter sp. G13]
MTFRFLCIAMMLGAGLGLQTRTIAQNSLHLQFMPNQATAQFIQPAYVYGIEGGSIIAGGSVDYLVGNNAFALDMLNQAGPRWEEDARSTLVDALNGDTRFRLGLNAQGILNVKLKNHNYSLSFRNRIGGYSRINNPQTMGLLLFGNAQYAGTTVQDENLAFRQYSFSEIGLGTGIDLGKVTLGVRIKGYMGHALYHIEDLSYALSTSELGDELALQSTYEIFESTEDASMGAGAGLDLGLIVEVQENLTLQASLLDLGFIRWEGQSVANDVNVTYSGAEIVNLFDADLQDLSFLLATDTLLGEVFPDTTEGAYTMGLPGSVNLGASWIVKEHNNFFASFHYDLDQFGRNAQIPLFNVGYHRTLGAFRLGLNSYVGGVEGYGVGAMGAANFKFGSVMNASLFAHMDNLVGLVAPGTGRGYAWHMGLTVGFP